MRIGIYWKVITIFLLYIFFSTIIILLIYHFTESPESISVDIRSAVIKDSLLTAQDLSRMIKKSGKKGHYEALDNPSIKYFLEKTNRKIRLSNIAGKVLYDSVKGRVYGGNVINYDKISEILSKGILIEGGYSGWFRSTVEVYVPIKVDNEVLGILQISYPKISEKRVRSNLKYGILVEVAVISLLALFFSRLITAPIKKLETATKMVTDGNLGYQVDIRTNDEIGGLAKDFNEMSKKLADMTRQRIELTADISHELRSPLARIKTAAEMMTLDRNNPQQLEKYQQTISQEIEELNILIEDLLELSKLELDKVELNLEYSNPSNIISEIIDRVKPLAEKKDIKIEYKQDNNTPNIMLDIHRMRRALSNIIENAIKFTNQNGHIIIAESFKGDSLTISVADDGVGVPESELSSIFERFYRIDKSRARQTGGTGLGLAIAKSIVERHGGKIVARKSDMGGLEIVISIPTPGFSKHSFI
ncbi:MAG: sensor histidine kinase [Candidatus Schekmanbacteria bacterium]|nr:MAG: sensor histidine kinase [Candidatus Schekmanbacteria bacterium]